MTIRWVHMQNKQRSNAMPKKWSYRMKTISSESENIVESLVFSSETFEEFVYNLSVKNFGKRKIPIMLNDDCVYRYPCTVQVNASIAQKMENNFRSERIFEAQHSCLFLSFCLRALKISSKYFWYRCSFLHFLFVRIVGFSFEERKKILDTRFFSFSVLLFLSLCATLERRH